MSKLEVSDLQRARRDALTAAMAYQEQCEVNKLMFIDADMSVPHSALVLCTESKQLVRLLKRHDREAK